MRINLKNVARRCSRSGDMNYANDIHMVIDTRTARTKLAVTPRSVGVFVQ